MSINRVQLEAAISKTADVSGVLSRTRSEMRTAIVRALKGMAPVEFAMDSYWKGRTDLPESKAFAESVIESSYGVDYYPDGDTDRKGGFVTGLRWDAGSGNVMVDGLQAIGYADGTYPSFSVPLDYIDDPENVVRFLLAFAPAD